MKCDVAALTASDLFRHCTYGLSVEQLDALHQMADFCIVSLVMHSVICAAKLRLVERPSTLVQRLLIVTSESAG